MQSYAPPSAIYRSADKRAVDNGGSCANRNYSQLDGANGNGPLGGLILGGNTLYGTTSYGGAKDDGTVFSVPVSGGTPTTLASFNDSTSGTGIFGNLVLVGSILCGTTHAGELRLYQWV